MAPTSLSTHEFATNATNSSSVAAPYATKLNGVNQPLNMLFKDILCWSLGVLAMLILTLRLAQRAIAHFRHIGAMELSGEAQTYWKTNRYPAWVKFKRHILYAPLWNKRHNREIKLSSAVNMGTIPSRFHTILLAMYIIFNASAMLALNYRRPDRYSTWAELRGRSGVLGVVNMIALVIFAGRNNPLITLLQISFDTYNLMHRWIGRMVVLEILIHTLCWAVVKHAAAGWSGVWHMLWTDPFISWGTVGTIAMTLMVLHSVSPVRHAFYETFVCVHVFLFGFVLVGAWIHCDIGKLPQLPIIKAVFSLWLLERVARLLRIAYINFSRKDKGWAPVTAFAMAGGATRVTVHLPRHATVNPGTHAYLRFKSINPFESHPFSIAWVEDIPAYELPTYEKGQVVKKQPEEAKMVTDVSFIIHAQTGMTKKLHDEALKCKPHCLELKGWLEGPYAGHHSLDSYGHAVLFAGSSGITHQIPYVRHLIQGFNDGIVATRRVTLIWIIRDTEHLDWVKQWMDVILQMPRRKEILRIKLYITRPKHMRDINSPSTTVQMFPMRPNVKELVRQEVDQQKGAMCVTVCGPGALSDDVREGVRLVQDISVVDFIEESFTW